MRNGVVQQLVRAWSNFFFVYGWVVLQRKLRQKSVYLKVEYCKYKKGANDLFYSTVSIFGMTGEVMCTSWNLLQLWSIFPNLFFSLSEIVH